MKPGESPTALQRQRTAGVNGGVLFRSIESQSSLEDCGKAEISEGVFEVRVQPLDCSHLRVRDIFHRQSNPLFPLSKRSDRMPELVPVKNDHVSRLGDQLEMA